MLNSFKWYRKWRGGRWEHISHKGISCGSWFKNRSFKLSSQEEVLEVENYLHKKFR